MSNTEYFYNRLVSQKEDARLFYFNVNRYLFDCQDAKNLADVTNQVESSKKKTVVYLPLVVDTEYQTMCEKYRAMLESLNLGSLTLIAQVKGINNEPRIYCHWDMGKTEYPLHFPLLQSECVAIDYLKSLGYKTSLSKCEGRYGRTYYNALNKKRVLRLVIYAHFAVADFYRLFNGQLRTDLLEMSYKPLKGSRIRQKRRLTTEYTYGEGNYVKEYIRPYWTVTIGDLDYALEFTVIDTGAIHGAITLAEFAENTGTPLEAKDLFDTIDKADMLFQYLTKVYKFTKYSLGDLIVYDALANNAELFKQIYEALEVSHYYKLPALTIGATVSNLFRAVVAKYFEPVYGENIDDKTLNNLIDFACVPSSANELIKRENSTGGLNAKVLGGRCFNNRPLDTVDIGVIADTDIDGCYGEGMRNQEYPFGKPVIIDYPKKSNKNNYLTLREFLNRYRSELVPGLWQLWFSVTKDVNPLNPKDLELPSPQDYFSSYHPPKKWEEMKSDTDTKEESWLELLDDTKIYSHQITNALLTHDGLQWLENICSRPLKNFILDNSIITTAMFYPASQRVNTPQEFIDKIDNHVSKNTSEALIDTDSTTILNAERECKAWFVVNLGELIVNKLLLERKKHKKGTPLNKLFKLCINTLYGDMVSKYFETSNVVVGNNITARARTMVWYPEKGLYGHGSITDGGGFNVNRVAYAKSKGKLNDINCTQTNRLSSKELDKKQIKFAPIGNYQSIEWCENTNKVMFIKNNQTEFLEGKQALQKIDNLIVEHLRNQFKGVDVLWKDTTDIYGNKRLGQFSFETKGLVKKAVFHGQSNYLFQDGFHDSYEKYGNPFIAMRSYEKDTNGVASDFLGGLLDNPNELKRQSPFTKYQIVKVGDYQQRYESFYSSHTYIPGDTIQTAGFLRELSLSQFTFKNQKQRDSWEKNITKLKETTGQSLEGYFENLQTGKINYQAMIEAVDKAIDEDCLSFKEHIDKFRNFNKPNDHPSFIQYLSLKANLAAIGVTRIDMETAIDEWNLFDEDYHLNDGLDELERSYLVEATVYEGELDW